MKLLHTGDWHVGRAIRGRSRADEHEAVLAEMATVAADHAVDLVIVAGDLFDTAAPAPESERLVYRALLDLAATGAAVVVLAGNHDSDRRLQAVAPLLRLGHVVTAASFTRPDAGGVVEVRSRHGAETALVALLPFLSQRYVVRADELMGTDAGDHAATYADRCRRLLGALTAGFRDDTVNIVAAHCMVDGGLLGGGERPAHTIFEYAVSPLAFPSTAHYVALGHLHRQQRIPGPCPIHYAGSPLQLDFGEGDNRPGVLLVEAAPGRPARVEPVPLSAGRRLVTVRGTLAELAARAPTTRGAFVRAIVHERQAPGLADEVRALFDDCVDVVVATNGGRDGERSPVVARSGRTPHELFASYLHEHDADDERVRALFAELLDELDGDEGVGAGAAPPGRER